MAILLCVLVHLIGVECVCILIMRARQKGCSCCAPITFCFVVYDIFSMASSTLSKNKSPLKRGKGGSFLVHEIQKPIKWFVALTSVAFLCVSLCCEVCTCPLSMFALLIT